MDREKKESGIPWIGEIPANWDVLRYKYVMKKVKEIKEKYLGEDIISLTMNGVIIRNLLDPKGKMPTSFDGYQKIYKNNLLLCLFDIDVTPRCVGLICNNGLTSPAYSQFKILNNSSPEYFNYQLRYIDDLKAFLHLSKNIRSSLTESDFGSIGTVCPPIKEQQQIASFLDQKSASIDSLISLQEKMIEELKAYKQSVITEAVTKGLDKSVPMKDSGIEWIGEVPEHWEIKRLKNSGYLYSGLSGKSGDDFDVTDDSEFAYYIPFTNIFNNIIIDLNNLSKVKTHKGESQNSVQCGDLLFLMSSEDYEGIGKAALLNDHIENLYLNSFCKGFRITDINLNPKYLNYFFQSFFIRELIRIEAKGFIRINLRMEKLAIIPILIPTVEEQYLILDYLDESLRNADRLILTKQQKIEQLKEYKKSIIYEYVTGKKQVPN